VASWEAAEQKVGPREKMQGPHAEPAEGESDGPPEAAGEMSGTWVCTLSCPTEEAVREKKLKKPGEFTRYEILKALFAAVANTNGARPGVPTSKGPYSGRKDPLFLKHVVVFQERHASGEIHYHVALRSDDVPTKRPFRFKPIKDALRESVGLESHWSLHGGYASCVAYGYVPSAKKPLKDLDPTPLRWAREGVHPPLAEASVAPVTGTSLAASREDQRLHRAEKGKPEGRYRVNY